MSAMKISILFFVAFFAISCAELDSRIKRVDRPVSDQYIVVFKETSDVSSDVKKIQDIIGRDNTRKVFKNVLKGVTVKVKDAQKLSKILDLVSIVHYVQQDGMFDKYRPKNLQASSLAMTWGLDRINQRNLPLDQRTSFTGNGSGVSVYIIDSGIYPQHEYFGGRASVAYDASDDEENDGIDCDGHGTHCAGTIGADYYGVARGAKLLGVKVFSCEGYAYWSWLIAAMDWVAENHKGPAVASMSLGGGRNDAGNDAVRGLYEAGVTVVVSAGNSNYDACYESPSSAPEAITVGATDKNDYRAYFSNYGACVDIFAPGVEVLSTVIGHPTATGTYSGTSMSCPHVAGVAALILGNNNNLTPKEVREKLLADATTDVLQEIGEQSPDKLLYAS